MKYTNEMMGQSKLEHRTTDILLYGSPTSGLAMSRNINCNNSGTDD